MIRITLNNDGEITVTQHSPPPAVYLDHWALRTISEDERLAARLVTVLETRQGTLALSWANLVEFAKVESQEQAHRAENLIENTLPRLFLLEVNPAIVIDREDALLAGGPAVAPHADPEFLRALALLNRDSVAPLSARGLFGILRDEGLVRRAEAFGEPSSSVYHQLTPHGGIETPAERINAGVALTG